jgi:hypothetical protein
MTRTRISLLTVATALGASLPAFAQAPAPAPMYAPAQAPMMAPAPEAAVMPAAPMMAPRAGDDMTGSVGLGVGVLTGAATSLVRSDDTIAIKYWMSDMMALVPRLVFSMTKSKAGTAGAQATPTAWQFNPELLASFVLLKGASTRLTAGAGLGIDLSKNIISTNDATFGINLPIELGVEHFFARWFSMGLAVHENFLSYAKTGDAYNFALNLSTPAYMGSLFFYTD